MLECSLIQVGLYKFNHSTTTYIEGIKKISIEYATANWIDWKEVESAPVYRDIVFSHHIPCKLNDFIASD
jgi:hypothetical protein